MAAKALVGDGLLSARLAVRSNRRSNGRRQSASFRARAASTFVSSASTKRPSARSNCLDRSVDDEKTQLELHSDLVLVATRIGRSFGHPVRPIAGSLCVVSDGHHPDGVIEDEVDDLVRKPGDWHTSDRRLDGDAWHRRSGQSALSDAVDGAVDDSEKVMAEAGPALLVPVDGMFDFECRFWFERDRQTHSAVSLRSIRLRTSAQGSPREVPSRTRAARRSISVAQS